MSANERELQVTMTLYLYLSVPPNSEPFNHKLRLLSVFTLVYDLQEKKTKKKSTTKQIKQSSERGI